MRNVVLRATLLVYFSLELSSCPAYGQSKVQNPDINEHAWPTVSGLAASGQDWRCLSELQLSDRGRSEVQRIVAPWMHRHCPQVTPEDDKRRIASVSAEPIQLQSTEPNQLAISEIGD